MSDKSEASVINHQRRVSNVTYAIATALLLLAISVIAFLYASGRLNRLNSLILAHFPATVGVMGAASISFLVVAIFRTAEGQITFQIPGFKFEGASGPILMWVICFLAIVTGISVLWPLG